MWNDLAGYLQHLAEQCSAAYSFQRRGLAAWCACKKTSAASNSLIININNQIEIIMFMILQLHDFHDQIIILGKLLRTFVWSCFILGYAALQNCKSWSRGPQLSKKQIPVILTTLTLSIKYQPVFTAATDGQQWFWKCGRKTMIRGVKFICLVNENFLFLIENGGQEEINLS